MSRLIISNILFIILILIPSNIFSWGFKAHKDINNAAVFTLPKAMFGFYKKNIDEITERAVNADKRRYAIAEEGCRHYLDADQYEKSLPLDTIPHNWNDAVKKYTKDTLMAYGILPWYLQLFRGKLIKAFEKKDAFQIIKLSADIGHYAADLHVPLHATKNYNGQLTNQIGIHSLFESRMYELFSLDYNLMTGKAKYIDNINETIWERFSQSVAAVDSVFLLEKLASAKFPNKYVLNSKGTSSEKVYNKEFCKYYNKLLNGMIERRIKSAIDLVGSLWYSCWVDAGQPDLQNLKFELPENNDDDKNIFQKIFDRSKMLGRDDE
ncbi:MAG: S1/P1 Nuclease [Bacteroidia bacterium]|nr:S1/P1 Nuclease [Bacteroidia bacterium]